MGVNASSQHHVSHTARELLEKSDHMQWDFQEIQNTACTVCYQGIIHKMLVINDCSRRKFLQMFYSNEEFEQ